MISEHIIYSAALAILVGMVFYKFTGRDPSWIIIVCSIAPDLDELANPVLRRLGISLLLDGSPIKHGTFHNIAFMVVFGIAVAFLLHPIGVKFTGAFPVHAVHRESGPVLCRSYPVATEPLFFKMSRSTISPHQNHLRLEKCS